MEGFSPFWGLKVGQLRYIFAGEQEAVAAPEQVAEQMYLVLYPGNC